MTTPTKSRRRRPARPRWITWFHNQTRQVKAIVGGFTLLAGFVASVFVVDSRYANARDVTQLRSDQQLYALQHQMEIQNLRKSQVMDKVHELSAREAQMRGRGLPPFEKQALERYRMEANDLSREIEQKRRLIESTRLKQ